MAPRGFETQSLTPGLQYRIRVKAVLDQRWAEYLGGLTVTAGVEDTVLSGTVPDPAALHELLTQLRDLGLPLRKVETVDAEEG